MKRALKFADVFVLQFSMICVLGSVAGFFTDGLTVSGPAFVGAWILGGILQLSVALAMAELTSAYPVAGSCYSWLRSLSHNSLAWFTGYLLLAGYIGALADNDMAVASSLFTFAGITNPTEAHLLAVAVACLIAQALISMMNIIIPVRVTAIAVGVQLVAISGIVSGLLFLGLRHSPALLFNSTGTTVHEHMPRFFLLLMFPAWTLLGFDAPANLGGQMNVPKRTAPRGLMVATLVSFIGGIALIAVPLLAMTDLAKTRSASSSFLYIIQMRMGTGVATLVDAVVVAALLFQPVVLLMVVGRLLWAQARDGAWPAATWLTTLNRWGAPARATALCALIAAIFCLIWPVAYGLATAWPALWYLAYTIAIAVGFSAKTRGHLPGDRGWNLKGWGMANDVLAAGWSAFIVVLLPLFDAVHGVPMLLIVILVGLLLQFVWIKLHRGPPRLAAAPITQ